jgi:hypothetical protein
MTGVTSALEQSHRYALGARRAIAGAPGVVAAPVAWARLGGLIDAYESGVRLTSDGLRAVAHAVDVDPLRTIAAISADVVRDIGAAQVSVARWLLDA